MVFKDTIFGANPHNRNQHSLFNGFHHRTVDADWKPCRPDIPLNPAFHQRSRNLLPALRDGRQSLSSCRPTTKPEVSMPSFKLWTEQAGSQV